MSIDIEWVMLFALMFASLLPPLFIALLCLSKQ